MKKLLLIPGCALLALGVLTSCQKEDKTAQQLADELTAELQKVTDYKTAEAAAPRVEALNKRFQDASVRTFSLGSNALTDSSVTGYAESCGNLAKEIGRVQASKPVKEADGEVDEDLLIQAVGVGAGAEASASAKERTAKGKTYLQNENNKDNNNMPDVPPCYGSKALASALKYTADVAEFPATRMDSDGDVPAIPAAVEPADDEEPAAAETEDETPAADTADDTTTASSDDEDDTTPAATSDDEDTTTSSDEDDDTTSTTSSDDDDDDSSSSSSSDEDDDDDATIDIDL